MCGRKEDSLSLSEVNPKKGPSPLFAILFPPQKKLSEKGELKRNDSRVGGSEEEEEAAQ